MVESDNFNLPALFSYRFVIIVSSASKTAAALSTTLSFFSVLLFQFGCLWSPWAGPSLFKNIFVLS